MIRRSIALWALALGGLAALAPGCSSDDEDPPATMADAQDAAGGETAAGDVEEDASPLGESFYSMTVVFPSGLAQTFSATLDNRPFVIAYGSSHIAPAVSLAVEDTLNQPFATLNINFGFVVGSNDYTVTIAGPGDWAWGVGEPNAPPSFKINAKDEGKPYNFVSWLTGASGKFTVQTWGTQEGELIEGSLEGTLVAENDSSVTATVSGTYRIVLPPPGQ